jgi:integrase
MSERRKRGTGGLDEPRPGRHRARVNDARGKRVTLEIFDQREKAERALAVFNAVVDKTELPDSGQSFRKFGEDQLDKREKEGVRDIRNERSRWKLYISPAPFADLRPREVTSARVRPWLEGLLLRRIKYPYDHPRNGQRLDIETVRRVRAGLSVICEAAVGEGLMDVNPVAGIRLRDRRGKTEDPWTYLDPDEQTALLRKTSVPDRLIIEIAMYTGIRPSSLARVRLEDVSVAGSDPRIVVRFGPKGGPTKNGRPYTVHLIPRAAKSVQAWLKLLPKYAPKNKAKLLLPTRDGSRRPTDHNRPFLDTWPDHLRAAGITRHVRWYDLRHTCASSLVSGWWTTERWTLDMMKVYLGHMSRLSTERYAHLGELAMTQAARGDRRVTLRKVTGGADSLKQPVKVRAQPLVNVRVGRPGLEPGTYGLKVRSSTD